MQLFTHHPPLWLALCACLLLSTHARADIDPNSGIDFVRIGAVGNAPWQGDPRFPNDGLIGLGTVNYQYNIGRTEVPTSVWTEFFNAAFDRPVSDRLPHVVPPNFWGAVPTTPNTPGGQRWRVPVGNELRPVGNIDWRMAAMLCNWLHNNKSSDRSAFLNGAYDVSTFGYTPGGFTDQQTHHSNAKYWIPSLDEWIKAAHYDPNKNGQGQGGWWLYPNASDSPLAYGPPGQRVRTDGFPGPDPNGPLAQANAGWDDFHFPGFNPYTTPLGAYPSVQSPWGLLDVAGGTIEWTEFVFSIADPPIPQFRVFDGSYWTTSPGNATALDRLGVVGGDSPSISIGNYGFRIASSVPVPSSGVVCFGCVILLVRRTRRHSPGTMGQERKCLPCRGSPA